MKFENLLKELDTVLCQPAEKRVWRLVRALTGHVKELRERVDTLEAEVERLKTSPLKTPHVVERRKPNPTIDLRVFEEEEDE